MADLLGLVERDTRVRRVAATGGGEWAGACPTCGGRDRFRVWPHAERPHYWCRSCGQQGDTIQYLRDFRGLRFQEAQRELGQVTETPASTHHRVEALPVVQVEPPSAQWQAAARAFAEQARAILWSAAGADALAYLREKRGLTDDTIRAAGLGYCPKASHVRAAPWGLGDGEVWLPRGVTIPCEVDGEVWYVKVRRPRAADPASGAVDELAHYVGADPQWKDGTAGPKYLCPRGYRAALFGTTGLAARRIAVIAEGEFDALLLHQEAGDLVDVVTLGSASLRLEGRWLPYLRHAAKLIAAFDTDHAGGQAAVRLAAASRRTRIAKVFAKDLTDLHRNGGDLRSWAAALVNRYGAPQSESPVSVVTVDTHLSDPQPDPRPNFADDSRLWGYLLSHAGLADDADDAAGAYGALHGVRCSGARLEWQQNATLRIESGTEYLGVWEDDRQTWLLAHRDAIAGWLDAIAHVEGEVHARRTRRVERQAA